MSILKSYMRTIADAIREKKGTSGLINARNFASEILSIQGGASLNLAYSLTPPADTSKIWLACEEPQAVEVQNYLGECAVSDVAYYGGISNPVDDNSSFYGGYYSSCYIENNQIAIVGYNHIRIYDLTTKAYIADYTISVGTSAYYSNVLYKDSVLYFGFKNILYSFDLTTQILTKLYSDSYQIYYVALYSDTEIDLYLQAGNYSRLYRYNMTTQEANMKLDTYNSAFGNIKAQATIKANDTLYNFDYWGKVFKYVDGTSSIVDFTSWTDFVTNTLNTSRYDNLSVVYDGERFIYLIGGGNTSIGFNSLIRYDIINDSFEMLDQKLLSGKYKTFSILIDNRIYILGGDESGTYYGRKNLIDYFDISYPLTQNNAIITTNTINTDNALPLINTDKLKLNSNIASAYKGNADNLAEKVNAYYWNGSTWKGINCEDYVESNGGSGGGLGGSGDATTDPDIPIDKPVEI